MSFLQIEKINKKFGGLTVLNNICLNIERTERRAIIGSNGAGKTTLFNIIGGEILSSSGSIFLEGANVTRLRSFELAGKGIARTFQKNNLFWGLTVFENVRLAVQRYQGINLNFFRPVLAYEGVNREANDILDQIGLTVYSKQVVRDLSYGVQRQVEVAVALASKPKLLLLDEPTAGMSPVETNEIVKMIIKLPREITMLLIEHDLDVVKDIADSVSVLHNGHKLAEGSFGEVKNNPRVTEILLGLEEKDDVVYA